MMPFIEQPAPRAGDARSSRRNPDPVPVAILRDWPILRKRKNPGNSGVFRRAGEGTRTLDMQLGKLPLYQLSYARDEFPEYWTGSPAAAATIRRLFD
jgi:hypothetical protein